MVCVCVCACMHVYVDASCETSALAYFCNTVNVLHTKIETDQNRIESGSFECELINFIVFTLASRI